MCFYSFFFLWRKIVGFFVFEYCRVLLFVILVVFLLENRIKNFGFSLRFGFVGIKILGELVIMVLIVL